MSPFQPYLASESMLNQTYDRIDFGTAGDWGDDTWVGYDDSSGFTFGDVMSDNMHFGLPSYTYLGLVHYYGWCPMTYAPGLDAPPTGDVVTLRDVPASSQGLDRTSETSYSYAVDDYRHLQARMTWTPAIFSGDPMPIEPIGPIGFNTVASQAVAIGGFGSDRSSRPPTEPLPRAAPRRPKLHACDMCPPWRNVAFTHKKDLKRHMDSVHPNGCELTFYCRCGKSDVRKDNYLRHVESCKKEHRRSHYVCGCGSSIVEMKLHMNHVKNCR